MVKIKTAWFCNECGTQSPKWLGKCPSCGAWNTMVEEILEKAGPGSSGGGSSLPESKNKPSRLSEIRESPYERIPVPDKELERVLGGGIVPGSLVLIGGEPGIGKSTLLLQLALGLKDQKVLYVSGEESARQISLRAARLNSDNPDLFLLSETNLAIIEQQIMALEPSILVVDSIQTVQNPELESGPGSVTQIRESAHHLQRLAKSRSMAVILVGHINKEGSLAGPKVLEHMVDTVLQFEGDTHYAYRMLRTSKNRFGNTDELGIYEMKESGLQPVSNPSEILITKRGEQISGISIGATLEGLRPLLVEIQALVTRAVFSAPQRTATGFDNRRLNMLLAVLEKRLGLFFGNRDVFLNVAGGLRLNDPAMDLAVALALISSFEDKPLPSGICFSGEISLGGEIRPVARIDQRISEAARLGFNRFVHSSGNEGALAPAKIATQTYGQLLELYRELFKDARN